MKKGLLLVSFCFCLLGNAQSKRWVEPSEVDTIIDFKNLSVSLSPSQHNSRIIPYYISLEAMDSLAPLYDNSYEYALALEHLQQKKFPDHFRRKGDSLWIKLQDESWLLVKDRYPEEENSFTFEYYFEEYGYYSIRVQWDEGDSYLLIDAQTGRMQELGGRPHFSPNGVYLLALGNDYVAQFSFNGFQVYRIEHRKLKHLGNFEVGSWGCVNLLWKTQKTAILQNESLDWSTGEMYFPFYSHLIILE